MENKTKNSPILNKKIWLVLCILAATVSMIPYLILGENSIVTYHDQLDGELLNYIINAKHLFSNTNYYIEVMNGIHKNGMAMPAPGFVILFYFFKPFTAFMISKYIIQLVSICFMFLLIEYITDRPCISFCVAIMFMMLPFYMVYGLCIPGLPMIAYACIKLSESNSKNTITNLILVILYGITSSLSLIGFAVIGFIILYIIALFIIKRPVKKVVFALIALIVSYILINVSLILQILKNDSFISHRGEIKIKSISFCDNFVSLVFKGADYTESMQRCYLVTCLVALIILIVSLAKKNFTKFNKGILVAFVTSIISLTVIAIFCGIYQESFITDIRNNTSGIIHDFNLARANWVMPIFWMVLLGSSLAIIETSLKNKKQYLFYIILTLSILPGVLFAAKSNDLKDNIIKLVKGNDYYMMTWKQFYAEDLFREVDTVIGKNKEDYRVVSYGIYPAAALYNGFYCLDAYSNNYDINYKHDFEEIIEDELNKSEYLSEWFREWGNRCYIVQSETNNYFTFEKKWTPYSDYLNLNLDKLKEMGCHYIISASYIINAEESGLTLISDAIMTDDSWYRLWVYTF